MAKFENMTPEGMYGELFVYRGVLEHAGGNYEAWAGGVEELIVEERGILSDRTFSIDDPCEIRSTVESEEYREELRKDPEKYAAELKRLKQYSDTII